MPRFVCGLKQLDPQRFPPSLVGCDSFAGVLRCRVARCVNQACAGMGEVAFKSPFVGTCTRAACLVQGQVHRKLGPEFMPKLFADIVLGMCTPDYRQSLLVPARECSAEEWCPMYVCNTSARTWASCRDASWCAIALCADIILVFEEGRNTSEVPTEVPKMVLPSEW